ncbi:hypothetical protein V7R84_02520 [Arachnia propionica]|uniref:hypothetical protein n=1 Tax=Arachnia propionica TaxID=1750 RepID=UPI0030D3856A
MTQPPDPTSEYAEHFPLLPEDPVRVGDFWIDSRLAESPAGVIYSAHADGSDPVMLIHLRDGAASDPAARARFSGEINAMHIDTVVARGGQGQDEGRMAVRFRDEDDDPIVASHRPLAPWVALAFSGSPAAVAEAQRVLAAVDLVHTPQLGSPAGPDFQMHWWQNIRPGTWRMWPLPWPGRKDRAGWLTLLASFLLMLLLAAIAVLLAILVFQNQQKVSPPAPVPSSASASGGGSTSSTSGEPSSGEPSELESRSDTPSMEQPSGDSSGPGSPSPERKL